MLSIKDRQQNLKVYFNLYTGLIDGIEGEKTKDAYKKFQEKEKLKIDGIYGKKTDKKLITIIKDIQTKLNDKGYKLKIDGIIGENTINMIKKFQNDNDLVSDGIIGDETLNKLNTNTFKYFKIEEFTCKCGCNKNNIDPNLVKILDEIREHFNKPIIITSGSRCEKNNKLVGGVKNSKHLIGKASDFIVKGVNTSEVLNYTNKLKKEGKISYTYGRTINMKNAVHIEIK